MSTSAEKSFTFDPRTPLGQAIEQAEDAFARGDVAAMDSAYETATKLTIGDAAWFAISFNHVVDLKLLKALPKALERCTEYLAHASTIRVEFPLPQAGTRNERRRHDDALAGTVEFLLLRAEIHSERGRHDHALTDTKAIREMADNRLSNLPIHQRARLLRMEGLAATNRDDFTASELLLEEARQAFQSDDNDMGVALIDADLRDITVWRGEESSLPDTEFRSVSQTVTGRLRFARKLRNELHYEKALNIVRPILDEDDLDRALRPHVLFECIQLLLLIRRPRAAEQLLPELKKVVEAVSDPVMTEAFRRLTEGQVDAVPASPRFDQQVQHADRLIAEGRLDDAEEVLRKLHAKARTNVDFATWELVYGELERARYHDPRDPTTLRRAVEHLEATIERTAPTPQTPPPSTPPTPRTPPTALAEVRVRALHQCGDTYYFLGHSDRAMDRWHEASALEEWIADQQVTDEIRVGMLAHSLTAHELWIRAAADKRDQHGRPETAGVVVAMEAARGATILGQLVHEREGFDVIRNLPKPADLDGAQQWVDGIVRTLPRDQAIWMTHAIRDAVHHVIIGRGLLHHIRVPVRIYDLTPAIEDHVGCWSSPVVLETSIRNGEFDRTLGEIAALIHLDEVLERLPPQIRRIAIAPTGDLAKLPFAAMPLRETQEPLVHRFAVSDLVCLSALEPFHRRSQRQRGDRALLVHSYPNDLPKAAITRHRDVLQGGQATVAAVKDALACHRHSLIRFHTHGDHDETNFQKSWLQLTDGQLTPEMLRQMDLHHCGTLVLGACESGMEQRRGRNDRMGFVRAGMLAGSSSVIAAKWIAKTRIAAAVLDRFERYARFLPRDVALQRAQLDICHGRPGIPTDVPFYAHPARWACWSLYGDAGYQTQAGTVRRLFRKTFDRGVTVSYPDEPRRPEIFLSFAGADRHFAESLGEALRAHQIDSFIDKISIEPAQDIFARINEALEESDYFVLLWSHNTIGNESVKLELSAAIVRALRERRSFLFVVNLDGSELPLLLSPRKYIEFGGGWKEVAGTLVESWHNDRRIGRPAPPPDQSECHPGGIELYVRNDTLHIRHIVTIPPQTTGQELMAVVHESLSLKEAVKDFEGQVGVIFSYWLMHDNQQLPANKSLADLHITEHSEINLGVRATWFGPGTSGTTKTFLNGESLGLNKALEKRLIRRAFGHLMPRYLPDE